jgi:glycolate oxidase iron-sulfur subunit
MCLPTCPTYADTKLERHSPRGRIAMMRSAVDAAIGRGGEPAIGEPFAREMYDCLGCMACQSACPAGVDYAVLFEAARSDAEQAQVLPGDKRRFWRWLTLEVIFMRPWLLRLIGCGLRLWQRTGLDRWLRRWRYFGLLPRDLAELEPQTPRIAPEFSDALIAAVERPRGQVAHRVVLLTGCMQDLVFSQINRDCADVLLVHGCEVITPRQQPCCGSLHAHNGALNLARDLARRLIDSVDLDSVDAIVSNAGGCGSHLKTYGHLLAEDPCYAPRARQWDSKLRDIHEWLAHIGVKPTQAEEGAPAVTYHESCHLCHAQRVSRQPREVLAAIQGLELRELPEATWCCGSAGIYNITQPERSQRLLQRKIKAIDGTQANCVATANPGCHLQIQRGLDGRAVEVAHPVSLLAKAYRAEGRC